MSIHPPTRPSRFGRIEDLPYWNVSHRDVAAAPLTLKSPLTISAHHPTKNRLDSVFDLLMGRCEVVWRRERTPIRVQPDAEFGIGATELLSRDRTIMHGPVMSILALPNDYLVTMP